MNENTYTSMRVIEEDAKTRVAFRWPVAFEEKIKERARGNYRLFTAEVRAILDEALPGKGCLYKRLSKSAKKNKRSNSLEARSILEKIFS